MKAACMEAEDIVKVLPHRYPILLVDRVLESDWKTHIVGIKNLSMGEPFFQGHFPGRPVMPGVLQLEAMAQLGGILLNKISNRPGQVAYFAAIKNARFRRAMLPGDQIRMEVSLVHVRLGTARITGRASVDGTLACEAEMTFKIMDDQ